MKIKEVLKPFVEETKEFIKDFGNKKHIPIESDDIGKDGYPVKIKTAVLLSSNGQPLKTFQARELLMMLDDKFQKMITKEDDRKKCLERQQKNNKKIFRT